MWDLWTAQTVMPADYLVEYEGTLTVLLEYSSDGESWSALPSTTVSDNLGTVIGSATTTLAIPAGTYSAATWSATGTASGVSGSTTDSAVETAPSSGSVGIGSHGNGAL